jgi:hypothetical protein
MKTKLFKSITAILCFFIVAQLNSVEAQGNTCGTAESITIDGACDGPTTISQNNAAPTVACGAFTDEGWYTFTVSGGPINITITAVSGDGNLAYVLYNVACGSISAGATCVNTNNTNGSAQTETSTSSLVNGTYYLRIINIGTGSAGGNMSLTSLCITSPPKVITASIASTQSICQNASVTLTSTYTVNNGSPTASYQWYSNTINSNSGGTAIGGATSSTYSPPTGTAGTFYYYCCIYTPGQNTSANGPMSNVVTITVSATATTSAAGSDQTTGSCVTTANLAGNSPVTGTGSWSIISGPGAVTTPGSPTSGVTGLQAGVATTFRWTITNGACTSTDDVIITGGSCGNNDLCTGGIAVSCNNTYSGTTVGMNTDAEDPGCSAASAAGVWYILAGTGGSVTASLCGSSYDTRLDVFSGTSCASITTCVVGNDDFCGTQSQVTFATVIGTTYYILVNGYSTNTGTFTLNLSCCSGTVPNCATTPSPANTATGVSPCGTLSWTAATCNSPTSYDVYFGTTSPPPYVTNVTTTSYSPALTGSTTYYWEVRPRNASGPAVSCTIWSFTTAASSNPQYNLVDDATSAAPYSCVTLTPNAAGQRGCAWDQNSTLGFASNFTYDWTINLGSNDAGADGMAFVIQNDPLGRCKCGVSGNQLGAGGITNSLIVELDTYINWEDRDDGMPNMNTDCISPGGPESDHLDIWLNGVVNPSTDGSNCATAVAERVIPAAIPLQNGGADYNIENGLDHKLRISWNAGTSTLTASVMNNATTVTYATVSYSFNPLTVFGTNSPYFGFTGSTGGLTNQQTFCNPPALLPVEMADFNMNCNEGEVLLNWSTNSEHNNDYFKIEKSRNGQDYVLKSIIDGAGNSTSSNAYIWTDDEISSETNYFRLTQVDFDGAEKILNVISSNCNELSGLNINNLLEQDGQLLLKLTNEMKGVYSIEITDYAGKQIANSTKMIESGYSEIVFPDLNPSKGIYFVRISNSAASVVKKVGIF